MARIVIFGATHGIGRAAVDEALERGHEVRAFARSADSINLEHERLERMPGDALDPSNVRRALQDVDVAVQALGVDLGPRMFTGPVTLFSEATRTLLNAMHGAGVERLVAVTGFGAGTSRRHMRLPVRLPFEFVLGRVYRDKSEQERLIRQSELDWTIVRPARLTNGPRTERYDVLREPGDFRFGTISRRDVAHFLLEEVEARKVVHEAPVLAA